MSLKFANSPAPSVQEVKAALRNYVSEPQKLGCHSAPKKAIYVFDQDDRPQPRLDRDLDGGYALSVGRVRLDNVFDLKFVTLSHNSEFFPGSHSPGAVLMSGNSRYWSGWIEYIECGGSGRPGALVKSDMFILEMQQKLWIPCLVLEPIK